MLQRCQGLALAFTVLVLATANGADRFTARQKEHWAWKPPLRPAMPAVKERSWVRNPIDAFLLVRLEAAGLQPASPATREQLIRRATFDLLGLPPAPQEIDAFVSDPNPNAWEKVVDRLLASPHYGERWARHWLDLVRYADSNGYEHDEPRPDAWRYRDYVIAAFNADKPFDRFIREQLAGDELYPDHLDALVATGFYLLGPDLIDTNDHAQRRLNTLNDMTDTAGFAFLGLTIACAHCHDHKFEPIPQTDYYRLQAFFAPAVFRRDLPLAGREQQAAYEKAMKEYTERCRPLTSAIERLEAPIRQRLRQVKLTRLSDVAQEAHRTPEAKRTAAQREQVALTDRLIAVSTAEVQKAMGAAEKADWQRLQMQLKQFDTYKPAPLPRAIGLQDAAGPVPPTFVLERGELSNRAGVVEPGFPVVFLPRHEAVPAEVKSPRLGTTGRRSTLAAWIASRDNPLTARVLVNRLWQHHFGRGLVATPSDFGVRGEQPSHPELLDWLAVEFMERGWSIKAMHRQILLSAAYRQSTRATPEALAKDQENLLFSRMRRLRLEGESIRDTLLSVSGRLNPTMGGPGVFPPIPPEAVQGSKGWPSSPHREDHVRRSVYIFARRNLRFPFLEVFDLPDSNLSCPKRQRSTTATQTLALLNATDVMDAANALADRLRLGTNTEDERITRAYRLVLGRRPTAEEQKLAHEFLAASPLGEFCRALFNLNEFVYLD
jgi:hypothetical protein